MSTDSSDPPPKPPVCSARCAKPGREPHPCPYREELCDDDKTLCTCCEDCTYECAMDV